MADLRMEDQDAVGRCASCGVMHVDECECDAAFNAFADGFDQDSNEWLDLDVQEFFRAGYKAARLRYQK